MGEGKQGEGGSSRRCQLQSVTVASRLGKPLALNADRHSNATCTANAPYQYTDCHPTSSLSSTVYSFIQHGSPSRQDKINQLH